MKKEEKGEQCGREENARLLLKDNAKSEKKNKIQYYFLKFVLVNYSIILINASKICMRYGELKFNDI